MNAPVEGGFISCYGAQEKVGCFAGARTSLFKRLPDHLVTLLVSYLIPHELFQLATTCRFLSPVIDDGIFWRKHCLDVFELGERVEIQVDHKRLCRIGETVQAVSLVKAITHATSQDQVSEAPKNALTPSHCAVAIEKARQTGTLTTKLAVTKQMECGCCNGSSCYWSSAPTEDPKNGDTLTMALRNGLSLISSISVTPYCAYWQAAQPAYAPASARLELVHSESEGGQVYYKSPSFPVKQAMEHQVFMLPKPALFVDGTARVVLEGKVTRQPFPPPLNQYYICLSHCGIYGVNLSHHLKYQASGSPLGGGPWLANRVVLRVTGLETDKRCLMSEHEPFMKLFDFFEEALVENGVILGDRILRFRDSTGVVIKPRDTLKSLGMSKEDEIAISCEYIE